MTSCSTHLTPYADRTSVGLRYPPYRPYYPDSEPDSYYRQQPSRAPRPLSAVALKLQDPRLRCERNLGWSIDWAVTFLVDHLDQKNSPDAADIFKNIRIRAATLEKEGCSREIPYRVFDKLDETLFAGHLKNAVFLDIRNLGRDVSGAVHSPGWGLDPKVKRISIVLNADVLQHVRSKDIVAALIHHMIHAYFLVACGPQDEKELDYGRLGHGLPFGKLMMTIRKLSGSHGKSLSSLDYGFPLDHSRSFFHNLYHHRRRRSPCHRPDEKWYCSHCYSDLKGPSDGEIDEWYDTVCKPLLDLPETLRSSTVQIYNDRRHFLEEVPRAQTDPSTDSSEFLIADEPVLVPASKIDNYFSIRRAFEKGGSRYMEIHEDVSKDTFERFLELLHIGTYGPDPKHVTAQGRQGPPVIKSPATSEPYILTDIRIFKMGVLMGFKELKTMALERMYRHGVTHEDPVGLLAAIYDGSEPDTDLKTWVRKFLTRTPTSGDHGDWLGMGGQARSAITEPSNLAKLECDLLGYKGRFYDLLEKSTALKYEVGQAKRELFDRGLYGVPGAGAGLYPPGLGVPRQITPPLAMGMGMGVGLPVGGGIPMRGLTWGMESLDVDYRPPSVADPFYGRGLGFEDGSWLFE